jgi:DNA-directed RNA polymerase subunit beta'
LAKSNKVANIKKISPEQEPDLFGLRLLRKVRPIVYTRSYVYDATTSSGTLYVSGLKSHNTGGVAASRGAGAVDKFTRLNQLLNVPKILPGEATLSKLSGRVQRIEKDSSTNGHNIWIGGERHYAPAQRKLLVAPGQEVRPGDELTDGPINPHDLLPLTDIHRVQNYLTGELYNKIYKEEKVKRRNIETVVRSLTNLTHVVDPGDSHHLPGDVALRTVVEEHNRNLQKGEKPIIHEPLIRRAGGVALDQHEDWMARLNFERLRQTVLEGAAKGWKSSIHGPNPVPAYAFGSTFGKGTKEHPEWY